MRRLGALIAILFFALLSACTKKVSQADYGLNKTETLRTNILSEPPSLDWSKSTDTTSSQIQYNIMAGLAEIDTSDPELKAVPKLASSWETKDAKTWKFILRKDVKWTDGVQFTAQHVIDGWERILNPETASEYAYQLYNIKNARVYNEGKLKDFNQVGIKVTPEGDLIVELEQAKAYFPSMLGHHSMYPLRKDLVEKYGDKWTDPENMVSLGPFKLIRWDHDKAVILERNDTYFGPPAKVKYVLFYIIPEISTAMNMFDSGRLDALNDLPSSEIAYLSKKPEYRFSGVLGTYYYGFNTSKPPFDNPKVRKAVSMAVDRKQVTDLLAGGEIPITGWIPKGMMAYDESIGIKPDVEQARKLLDEAGYKDRKKFPRVTIGYSTSDNHRRIAENIQAQLKTNLGLDVQLSNEEWKTYLQTLKVDPPQIWRLGWLGDYPDPDTFMNLMTSYSTNNHTRWGNKKYDELVSKAVGLTDKNARIALYIEAQKILTEVEVPVIPIYTMVTQHLISPRVKDYPVNAMKALKYDKVYLEEVAP